MTQINTVYDSLYGFWIDLSSAMRVCVCACVCVCVVVYVCDQMHYAWLCAIVL